MLLENASNYGIVSYNVIKLTITVIVRTRSERRLNGLSRHSGPHAPRGVDGPRNKAQRGEEQEGPAHSPHAPRTLHATGRGAVRIPKTVELRTLTISRTSP